MNAIFGNTSLPDLWMMFHDLMRVLLGVDEFNTAKTLPIAQQLNDTTRINYYHDYLQNVLLAIK